MQGGNLSNDPTRRHCIVFEGLIATIDVPRAAKEKVALKMHRWNAALKCWRFEKQTFNVILDAAYRYSAHFDVLTFRPEGFAEALADRLDYLGYPTGSVWSVTKDELLRDYAARPDIIGLYVSTALGGLYGSKLLAVPDPREWRGLESGGYQTST